MRLILLLFFLPILLSAQRTKNQNVRYVWAASGLVMRAEGRASGEKMLTVPFGAEVRLTARVGEGLMVSLYQKRVDPEGEGQGWEQFAYYREVVFGRDTGYVHAAYLSRWSPAAFQPLEQGYRWAASPIDTLFNHTTEEVFHEESYLYPGGITVTTGWTEKAADGTIVLPNATFMEGFHFANLYFGLSLYSTIEPEWTHFFLIDQRDNELVFRQDMLEVTITSYWGVVVITHSSSC